MLSSLPPHTWTLGGRARGRMTIVESRWNVCKDVESLAAANNSVPTTGLTPCIVIVHVYI